MKPRPLKKIFKLIGVSILVVFIIGFALLQWPGLWLTPQTLEWSKNQINHRFETIDIQWSQVHTGTDSLGFLENRISLKFSDFCLRQKNETKFCFDQIAANFAYDLTDLELTEFGPLRAIGGEIAYLVTEAQESENEKDEFELKFPEWLSEAAIKSVFIEVNNYEIHLTERTLQGNFKITSASQANAEGDERTLVAEIHEKRLGDLRLEATTQTEKIEGPWSLKAQTDLHLPNQLNIKARAHIKPEDPDRFLYEASGKFRSPKADGNLALDGFYQNSSLQGKANGQIKAKQIFLLQNCKYELGRTSDNRTSIHSDCPVLLSFQNTKSLRLQKGARALGIAHVGVRLKSSLTTSYPPSADEKLSGRIQFLPLSGLSHLISTRGQFDLQYQMVPAKWPAFETIEGTSNLAVQIPSFQKVVSQLDETAFAIPTPFRTLGGAVSLTTDGSLNSSGGKIVIRLVTNLQSKFQSLKTKSQAILTLQLQKMRPQNINAAVDVTLSDIKLALPAVEGVPPYKIFSDGRIKETSLETRKTPLADGKKRQNFFHYQLRIHSPINQPMELISNLTKNPIAVGLDLRMKDGAPTRSTLDIFPMKSKIAGIEGDLDRLKLRLRMTDFQTIITSDLTDRDRRNAVEILYSPSPSDSLLRPQPGLPLPLLELATALQLKVPLSIVVLDERRLNPPLNQTAQNPVFFQIRRRY